MKTFRQLEIALHEGKKLIWNDPDPIEGNDYTISYINKEDLNSEDRLSPILIQYNDGGSEAQVFLHEILIKQ